MKTDYNNLNLFDAAVVAMSGIGIVLIGAVVFVSLPNQQKHNLNQALSIFDIGNQAQEELVAMESLLGFSNDYLDRFYVAFTQVATVSPDQLPMPNLVSGAVENLLAYADTIEAGYLEKNSPHHEEIAVRNGEVLGALIESVLDSIK